MSKIDPALLSPDRRAGSYTVEQMKAFARELNLPVSGTKAELYDRLIKSIQQKPVAAKPRAPSPKPRAPSPVAIKPRAPSPVAIKPRAPSPVAAKPNVCKDWRTCVQKGKYNGFDVLILPANTLLYKGVYLKGAPGANAQPRGVGSYFANFPVAASYAFASPWANAEQGKIIVFEVINPIYLLDMTSIDNYDKIWKSLPLEVQSAISNSFGYVPPWNNIRRKSKYEEDIKIVNWLCSKNLDGIVGYGYTQLPGFHSEVLICNPEDKVKLLPIEYRFSIDYNPSVLLETRNGILTGVEIPTQSIPTNEIIGNIVKWGIHNPRYITSSDPSDQYLCYEPFVSAQKEYLQRTTDYKDGDEFINCKNR